MLDEATNALDAVTEGVILRNLRELAPAGTVIMASHRLSSVRLCDVIYVLEHGRLKAQGSYDELRARHALFGAMT